MLKDIKNKAVFLFRATIAVLGILSLTYCLVFHSAEGIGIQDHLCQWGYFSTISSCFIVLIFILLLVSQWLHHPVKFVSPGWRNGALLYGIVTALLYTMFYHHQVEAEGVHKLLIYFNHVILVAFLMIDNIISTPAKSLTWDLLIYWMIFPFYYLIFVIIEGHLFDKQRYYFLAFDNSNIHFYPLALGLLAVIFLFLAALIIFINRNKKQEEF
jgi:hypothetical protein